MDVLQVPVGRHPGQVTKGLRFANPSGQRHTRAAHSGEKYLFGVTDEIALFPTLQDYAGEASAAQRLRASRVSNHEHVFQPE